MRNMQNMKPVTGAFLQLSYLGFKTRYHNNAQLGNFEHCIFSSRKKSILAGKNACNLNHIQYHLSTVLRWTGIHIGITLL